MKSLNYQRNKEKLILAPNSQNLRRDTFREYMDQYAMDAMATFDYEGLPETVEVNHIERPLFEMGHCVFTKHKDTGLPIVMPCGLTGFNIHGEPVGFIISSRDNEGREYYYQTGKFGVDGVLIKNNIYMKPTYDMLAMYCRRIADAEMTIDMQVYAMRKPFVFETDQYNIQQAKLLMSMYDDFEPSIFMSKGNNMNTDNKPLSVHNTGVESFLSDLMNYKHDIENNLYTRFGINNAMQDKKERMLVDEVNAKDEQISLAQSISLDYRKFAFKQVKELFGIDISVEKKGSNDDESSEYTMGNNSDLYNEL